jgi:hypothetical protein
MLQDKQGSHCTRFDGCGHVFCKSCVAGYFEVRIKEGNVKSICCPEDSCTSEAVPAQVSNLLLCVQSGFQRVPNKLILFSLLYWYFPPYSDQ